MNTRRAWGGRGEEGDILPLPSPWSRWLVVARLRRWCEEESLGTTSLVGDGGECRGSGEKAGDGGVEEEEM